MVQGAETGGYMDGTALSKGVLLFSVILSPAKVVKVTAAEQLFATPTGTVDTTDFVLNVEKAAQQANLVLGGTRVAAANSIGINFGNIDDTNDITPTATELYRVAILKNT